MNRRRVQLKEKEIAPPISSENGCQHYWVIEVANGPTSRGTCKHCGVAKDFFNVIPDYNQLKRNTNPLSLPEMPGITDKTNES
jgi:hypothetical protein